MESYDSSNFAMRYIDVIPTAVFIVDEDVKLLNFNAASSSTFNLDAGAVIKMRGGDALHCLHSFDHPDGCGRGPHCGSCIIRNSVKFAFENQAVYRKHHEMILLVNEKEQRFDTYITTAPIIYEGAQRVMLAVEDISELFELRRLVPICAWCKKIRNDKDYWESVDAYLAKSLSIDLTHGVCPDCMIGIKKEIAEMESRSKADQ